MDDQTYENAYDAWRTALTTLLGDAPLLATWQERRYSFAHRVGALLTDAAGEGPAITGPVLYGVFSSGAGLCYVGQTQDAGRRLRDLPVGESHHLANTVPPELWERVVVIRWPRLLSAAPADEQAAVEEMGAEGCGLALEHLLQIETAPPLNSRRRRSAGDWQPRNLARSRSRGALRSASLPGLGHLTLAAWKSLAEALPPENSAVVDTGVGRVVFPSALETPQGN
ncbi:hypothetical protein [Streptomyces sp. NBC_00102]|uniref:hypothetical protein n=1 Tax=Streptomyces sp. NBC_00102 TaxID=2975652 RepID=UPI002257997B|nr:hypothetical protein [Streptomyces sp. NBC_00102]MCX5397566.1 hypothetical protein [Streptomyces sp. NBC_00102]